MSYKEIEDEIEQRLPLRDSKGRFAKKTTKPIKPLPKVDEPFESKDKWGCGCGCNCAKDESDHECTCTSNRIKMNFGVYNLKKFQMALNPKKDCKNVYNDAHQMLIDSGGCIAKVVKEGVKKPFGYLVRVPSITNPDIVFLSFLKTDPSVNNTYFQKLTAIISTIIKGEKFIKEREESETYIDDIPFSVYFNSAKYLFRVDDHGMNHINFNNEVKYIVVKKNNYFEVESFEVDDDVIDYINRFEEKARNYYQEDGNNKTFVALPFTFG